MMKRNLQIRGVFKMIGEPKSPNGGGGGWGGWGGGGGVVGGPGYDEPESPTEGVRLRYVCVHIYIYIYMTSIFI